MGNIFSRRRRRLERIQSVNNVIRPAALEAIYSNLARERECANAEKRLRDESDANLAREQERANTEKRLRDESDANLAREQERANIEKRLRDESDANLAREQERANTEKRLRDESDANLAREQERANIEKRLRDEYDANLAREQERANTEKRVRDEYDAILFEAFPFLLETVRKRQERKKHTTHGTDDNNVAIDLFKRYGELELAQWPNIKAIKAFKATVEEIQKQDAEFNTMMLPYLPTELDDLGRTCELIAVPFHDPAQTRRFLVANWNRRAELAQEDEKYWHIMDFVTRGGVSDLLLNNQIFDGHINDAALRLCRASVARTMKSVAAGSSPSPFAAISEEETERDLENCPHLKFFNQLNCSKCAAAGENGYTGVFTGGVEYDISTLENHFLTRNTGPPENVGKDVITIALSYRHYWENRSRKLSGADLEGILRFIKASQRVSVRFWIDTRLPPTADGSFEKWLARGVGPYARYMTLICPSAAASSDRFWVSMEKYIGMSSKGVFYFEDDGGIYFTSRPISDGITLAKRMLQVMVGELEVPPGVNIEEEGKAAQWALGFLGSYQNLAFSLFSGPKLDEMTFGDYDENNAMTRIAQIIRRYGSLNLPVVPGRAWNKYNPLLKGSREHQKHRMVEWLGLANCEDKRIIYFVSFGELLATVDEDEENCVALRVTFRHGDSYDCTNAEGIEEKMLGEFPTAGLLKMKAVTVPITCDWPAFIDTY